jgi:hypothetical protein
MSEATPLWNGWQALLRVFATVFTRPGWVRFVPWVTGMVLCWEAHTLTQILTALGLEARWRVLEHCAEYGAWDRDTLERQTLRVIEQERPDRSGRSCSITRSHWMIPSCTAPVPRPGAPDGTATARSHWSGGGGI